MKEDGRNKGGKEMEGRRQKGGISGIEEERWTAD